MKEGGGKWGRNGMGIGNRVRMGIRGDYLVWGEALFSFFFKFGPD